MAKILFKLYSHILVTYYKVLILFYVNNIFYIFLKKEKNSYLNILIKLYFFSK